MPNPATDHNFTPRTDTLLRRNELSRRNELPEALRIVEQQSFVRMVAMTDLVWRYGRRQKMPFRFASATTQFIDFHTRRTSSFFEHSYQVFWEYAVPPKVCQLGSWTFFKKISKYVSPECIIPNTVGS